MDCWGRNVEFRVRKVDCWGKIVESNGGTAHVFRGTVGLEGGKVDRERKMLLEGRSHLRVGSEKGSWEEE